jgi:threonine/homoserine/homoserine lactone efflux protein
MDSRAFLAFVALATAVIVIPGPSVLLIVSNSLRFGLRGGLLSAVGISAAMVVQLCIAVAGITSLVLLLTDWIQVVRWIGIIYLCYLGVARWRVAEAPGASLQRRQGGSTLAQGFLVSLTNPTTMTFFVAFFPQFLNVERPTADQLVTMSLVFWLLAAGIDVAYALVAARFGRRLQNSRWVRVRNRLSGAMLLAAACVLALARAP